jgi:N-acetylmuramoyl-L-alanine amidase
MTATAFRRGVTVLAGAWLATLGVCVSAAEIQSLRLWTSAEYTRAVFDISGSLDYKLFEISKPDRIVLDLNASGFGDGFKAPVGKGLMTAVRIGKQDKTSVRVVFDLAEGVRPKSFILPPSDNTGYRLVVDLYPKSAAKAIKTAESAFGEKARKVIVAIDAGHGGEDPGAIGTGGTREKNVTLAVARELKRILDQQPGMSAVLTRDSDYFIPLKDRYRKARDAKADLFVSVHADAFNNTDARGSSVWMLSPRGATSEAARWLADRENRADLVGGVSLDDKDNTLAAVLLDLSQGATLEASGQVAENVLHSLSRIGPTHRGYVERANFVVLRSPDVPSILVETAFITNAAEEKRLGNPAEREKLAVAIVDGMRNYFRNAPPPGTWFAANAGKERPSEHVVTRGETLKVIADRHGISIASLRAANKLADDNVRIGVVLRIPNS